MNNKITKFRLTTYAKNCSEKITELEIPEDQLTYFHSEVIKLKTYWNIDYILEQHI